MQHKHLEPMFVTEMPQELNAGVLYVSMEYGTVLHRCCCGCGEEVVTPLTPTDWKLMFNGVAISLWPSIGNWNLPCKSHYVIRDNLVLEAGAWSNRQIESEIRRDKAAKAKFYGSAPNEELADERPYVERTPAVPSRSEQTASRQSTFRKLLGWLLR